MINPQWLQLLMSRTNLHGPKDVQVIAVRLYMHKHKSKNQLCLVYWKQVQKTIARLNKLLQFLFVYSLIHIAPYKIFPIEK